MAQHVALLGDSIFDNASYVPGEPAVLDIVRQQLPPSWQATLCAVDGACVADVYHQPIPPQASHLVLSVGGNDALIAAGELFAPQAEPLLEGLGRLGRMVDQFAQYYDDLLTHLRRLDRPLTVCTIYDAVPGLRPGERAGLSVFNDAITRIALRQGTRLIDLRLVCDDRGDYSAISPIEPSVQGGQKIAAAIVRAVQDEGPFRTVVT